MMREFFEYIKYKRRALIRFLLFVCIFAVSFALYRLPVAAVLYPAALCFVAGIICLLVDFSQVRRVRRALRGIKEDMLSAASELSDLPGLPAARHVTDEDYQALIKALTEAGSEELSKKEQSYRDMIDYYTVWAHQIKTPIASMRLTLQEEDSPSARKLTADLTRIESYVTMVLTYLRLDSSASDYVIRECSLDDIVKPAVKKFAGEFIGKKLSLSYEPLDLQVLTDEKWLSFVVEQVLSNALKYTEKGGISIYLEAPATLCIRDSGIGIAPEDLPRIFENGYTGFNGRTDRRASGIGLYLCKRICDNLGHSIRAESTPGEGTVIRIDLGADNKKYE